MKTKWKIDPGHSELFFKITHLMISEITGSLNSFSLDIETEGADFGNITEVMLLADANSIRTNNEARDGHLKSAEFFDVANHQEIKFEGSKFEKQGISPQTLLSVYRKDYKLYGNLTIKGITRAVVLDGEFGGTALDTNGQKKAGFTIRGKLSRKEFGLTWQGATEAGKIILGDAVHIFGNIQLIKQD